MDLLRGLTSNALDTTIGILQKKIRTGEDQDPFRSHSTRDIDDCIANIVANSNNGKNLAHPADFVFMILAGERASRSGDAEMTSQSTAAFCECLEQFMTFKRPAEEKAFVPGESNNKNKKDEDGSADDSKKSNKRPEPLNTFMDPESATAISHRFFAVAVRFYGERAVKISSVQQNFARRAIHYLNQCIDNWRPAAGHLTPAHAAIVELGLKTHNAFVVSTNGRLLQEAIYELNPNLSGVSIFDYLDYYYFGGLCYASLQQWAESAEMLQQVTLAPARGLSVRTIAAVKAHLLVTCILLGEGELPDNMRMSRYLSEICRDYMIFTENINKAVSAKVFDPTTFSINIPHEAYTDGLGSLAQQALNSIPSHRARNLTRTYLTVSLAALGAECGGTEAAAEAKVREMVLNKQLDCTIDRTSKVVTFSDNPTALTSSSSTNGVANAVEATTEEEALRNVMNVNKIISRRQDLALVTPGHALAMTPNMGQAIEMTKKELEGEKGGILGAFRR